MKRLDNQEYIQQIRQEIRHSAHMSPQHAARFFKTKEGEYAYEDQFIGVGVPILRQIALRWRDLPLKTLDELLVSSFNEERFFALIVLVDQYNQLEEEDKKNHYTFYLDHLDCVNNWNLVDASAHLIVGDYLYNRDKTILMTLAESEKMWRRRVAIVATWGFIKKGSTEWTYAVAKKLLTDSHDLIHKAVGWMLREAGKQNQQQLEFFLEQFAPQMPRVMLRYAIEKFPETLRQHYLLSSKKPS